MIIVRPAKAIDKEAFEKFAYTTHIGVTSLPKNKEKLKKKLQNSIQAFSKQTNKPENDFYLFMMEDLSTRQNVGTCGIYAQTGISEPIYFYKVETVYHHKNSLPLPKETRVLHPVSYQAGPSEIGGLYVLPEFRQGGYGRLLSLSRFLFIASFPERFCDIILSNMRGVIDEQDYSAFWGGCGRFFLDMEFKDVMAMLEEGSREFIPHFLPKYPVYVSLLNKEAQNAIGKTHPNTTPALNMLSKEGFRASGEIDIFDGGPILTAQKDSIRTIAESKLSKVGKISSDPFDSPTYIACNNRLDFRACFAKIKEEYQQVVIQPDVAEALNLKEGDDIRYVTSGHEEHHS